MRLFVNERGYALRTSIVGALVSLIWSVLHLRFDPLLNPDAVVYLVTAQAWLDAGYAAAAAIFPLPFYPMLIASIHTVTGLDLLTSAHCLDAALIAILIVGVQRLTWTLGGGIRAQRIAVVLALILPELNGLRSTLIRDFGYWALWVWALTCLLRYAQAPDVKRSIAFFVLCLAATAFRLEAIPLLLLMPFGLTLGAARRPAAAAALYAPATLAIAVGGVIAAASGGVRMNQDWAPAMVKMGVTLLTELPVQIQSRLAGFSTHVLDPGFTDYAGFGLVGGNVAMILVHVANAASLPLFAIAGFGVARRSVGTLNRNAAPLLWTALAIVLLGLAAVLLSRGIIQTRYAMPAGFLILVIAAFVIDDWYTRASAPRERQRLHWISAFVLTYFLGEAAFQLVNSKQHVIETAQWLRQNTASTARIFSSDARVVYLADRPVDWRGVIGASEPNSPPPSSELYDYWAVYDSRKDPQAQQAADGESDWQRVAQFANRKGDRFVIYQSRERR